MLVSGSILIFQYISIGCDLDESLEIHLGSIVNSMVLQCQLVYLDETHRDTFPGTDIASSLQSPVSTEPTSSRLGPNLLRMTADRSRRKTEKGRHPCVTA